VSWLTVFNLYHDPWPNSQIVTCCFYSGTIKLYIFTYLSRAYFPFYTSRWINILCLFYLPTVFPLCFLPCSVAELWYGTQAMAMKFSGFFEHDNERSSAMQGDHFWFAERLPVLNNGTPPRGFLANSSIPRTLYVSEPGYQGSLWTVGPTE